MFNRKPHVPNAELEEAIASALTDLKGFTAETEEHAAAVEQLTQLFAIRELDKPSRPEPINPNTLLLVAGNIFITAMIVEFERVGIVTSKAKDFWMKFR